MQMAMKDLWLEYMAIKVSIVMRLVRGKGPRQCPCYAIIPLNSLFEIIVSHYVKFIDEFGMNRKHET